MWIAREEDGPLWIHENKPYFNGDWWMSDGEYSEISEDMFKEVAFKNSPIEVELKINK